MLAPVAYDWALITVPAIMCCRSSFQPLLCQCWQRGVLFSPMPEPDTGCVLLTVALMHIPPRAASSRSMQHTIEKLGIISDRSNLIPAFGW